MFKVYISVQLPAIFVTNPSPSIKTLNSIFKIPMEMGFLVNIARKDSIIENYSKYMFLLCMKIFAHSPVCTANRVFQPRMIWKVMCSLFTKTSILNKESKVNALLTQIETCQSNEVSPLFSSEHKEFVSTY